MSLSYRSNNTCLVMLLLITAIPTMAQELIGEVQENPSGLYVIRNGMEIEHESGDLPKIKTGDIFGPKKNVNGSLEFIFDCTSPDVPDVCDDGDPIIFMRSKSSIQMDIDTEYSPKLVCNVKRGVVEYGGPESCMWKSKDGRFVQRHTRFEVDVEASNTRVFVFEGAVEVFSTDTTKSQNSQVVHAGEWVRFRKGEEIPKPQRFTMAIGPGSGSTECIYSDCKLVNNVLIPERPVVTPSVLIPPPPNPPGQR